MKFGYSIYFAERSRNRIVQWDLDREEAFVVAGEPPDGDMRQHLRDPYGLAMGADGKLLIADKLNHRVCRLNSGCLEYVAMKDVTGHRAPLPGTGPEYVDTLYCPTGLFVERDGCVLVAFSDDHTIYRVHVDGALELLLGIVRNRHYRFGMCQQSVPRENVADTPLRGPTGIVRRSDGTIFFIERGYQIVRQYSPDAGLRCVFPLALWRSHVMYQAQPGGDLTLETYHPHHPVALALDAEDNLFLADYTHRSVFHIDFATGRLRRVVELPAAGPVGLAFAKDGLAWLMDAGTSTVRGYKPARDGQWTPLGRVLSSVRGGKLNFGNGGAGIVAA